MEHMDQRATAPTLTEYQRCRDCGTVAPRYVEEFSDPTTHRLRRVYACAQCASWNVEHVTACATCRAAEAVCDDDCVKCAVAFYVANPEEFDVNDSCWTSSEFWIEAMNRIGLAIHQSLTAPVDRSIRLAAARSAVADLRGESTSTSEAA